MRKSITLAAITFLVVAAAYFSSCKEKKSEPLADNKEDSLQKVIARGNYLANNVAACIHCHSQRDFNKFSGPVIPGTEGGGGFAFESKIADFIPGVLYGKNITPDPETGIGTWTDDEILRAITQGIRKNGDTLFPIMPYTYYNKLAKDDLMSIIAYIRTLKPIKNKVPDRQLMIPISMAYPSRALQASIDGNVRPPQSDIVKYGEYLSTMADCKACHTPFVKGQPDFSRSFAGGNTFNFPTFRVTTSNISSDSATGLGTWTEERFLTKFTVCREEAGYNFNPGTQNTVMPISDYAGMTDGDLKAIYAYLKTVKPVVQAVEKYPK
jgi:mono/diheme cytochrome c family protein